jgi:hypothetical protein
MFKIFAPKKEGPPKRSFFVVLSDYSQVLKETFAVFGASHVTAQKRLIIETT